jgi:hypothetical protein
MPADFGYPAVNAAVALLGGGFVLRGASWARWLLGAWLAFHGALGAVRGALALTVHAALAAAIMWMFCRPSAAAWFRNR